MTRYLLDTNVASTLAPTRTARPESHPALSDWIMANTENLFLSSVTALEIESGIHKLTRLTPGRWQQELSDWFSAIRSHCSERIIPLDLRVARVASLLTDRSRAQGRDPGMADVAIAATAIAHGLVLLTRNLKHFDAFDMELIDPFERLPA